MLVINVVTATLHLTRLAAGVDHRQYPVHAHGTGDTSCSVVWVTDKASLSITTSRDLDVFVGDLYTWRKYLGVICRLRQVTTCNDTSLSVMSALKLTHTKLCRTVRSSAVS